MAGTLATELQLVLALSKGHDWSLLAKKKEKRKRKDVIYGSFIVQANQVKSVQSIFIDTFLFFIRTNYSGL